MAPRNLAVLVASRTGMDGEDMMGMKRVGFRAWRWTLAAPIALALSLAALLAGGSPPVRAQEGVCDNAPTTRLGIGQWAIVTDVVNNTAAGGLRLRDAPRTTSTEVDLLSAGTQVRIIDGPACNDGFQWYYLSVQPGGLEGWSAEAIPGSYYLAPSAAPPGETLPPPVLATNTPMTDSAPSITLIPGNVTGAAGTAAAGTGGGACPDDPLPSYLRVGAQARAADQAHPVRLRPTPEIDGIFTEMVYQDKVLNIEEGPLCTDGLTWWRVSVEGRPGWTVELAGDRYLLIDPANAPPQIVTGTLSEIPPSPTPVALEATPLPTARPPTAPAVDKHAVYTPDGTRLAVGAGEGVRLYDAASFTLQTTLPTGPVLDFVTIGGALFAVGWVPEGLTLTGVPDGTIRTVLVNAPSDPAWAAAAPDGRWLILGPTSDGATATLWDLDNARPALIPPFWWPGWGVIEAAFSPDNRYVLVNDVVSLRRCETAGPGCLFDLVRNDFLPAGIFGDVAWTPEGAMLAGFSDRLWLWDGEPIGVGFTLRSTLERGDPRRVALNADATRAAVAVRTLLEIWDLTTYTAYRVNTLPGPVSSLAYSPDGSQLAVAAGGTVSLYDPTSGLPLRQVE